jgi:uncharacterized protein (DUF1501 family)
MTSAFDLRRRFVVRAALTTAALAPWSTLSLAASTNPAGRRFVLVVLRGGLDGLSAVPAVGDTEFAAARGPLAQFAQPALPLDATFALHPNLVQLHAMFARGELAVVHAVGLPYRERSHFDAQQVLESGGARPYMLQSGWLGRALADGRGGDGRARAVALNTAVPLVLRGPAEVDTWAPSVLPEPSADLVARIERLYEGDAALAAALQRAKALHLEGGLAAMNDDAANGGAMGAAPAARGGFVVLAGRAAEFLVQPHGPQAAVLEIGGWDTHAGQANPNGALANLLRQLDTGLEALRTGLSAGDTWSRTVVVVATEFGREVAVNGTLGTDHGTGGAAFVLGGAVKGGRVVADWPGLAKKDRYEGRDLRTTTDLRGVLKGVLGDHLQVARARLESEVFPQSEGVRPLQLLA